MQQKVRALRHAVISLSVLIVLSILSGLYIWQVEKEHILEERKNIYELAVSQAYFIQHQLSQSLSATYSLAILIQMYGQVPNFDAIAEHIINTYGGISCIQLAPHAVVSQIYPLQGNEKAIGHDLLKDPARRTEALKTIQQRALTLAGPMTLIQGGVAVIGRLPVFIKKEGKDTFWGFTIALIRLDKLLDKTQINMLKGEGYAYELSRVDPDTGQSVIFLRSGSKPLKSPVTYTFMIPNGEWTIALSRQGDGNFRLHHPMAIVIAIGIALSFAWLTFILLQHSEEIRTKSMALELSNMELQKSLAENKQLSGLLPICSNCKKIRDEKGSWNQIESYIKAHSEADFSHSLCPECIMKLYPEYSHEILGKEDKHRET